MNSSELRSKFDKDGYVVIPGLLSKAEVAEYLAKVQSVSGLADSDFVAAKARRGGFAKPDNITHNRDLWPLIFHTRLVSAIRSILGPEARYTQHSDIHVHHGTVGWHRDSRDRVFGVGKDWESERGEYAVVRVAIYLQPYASSKFSLGVVPGSHRTESAFLRFQLRAQNAIRRFLNRLDWVWSPWFANTQWIPTEPGDCVIFDQRLLHTGSPIVGPKYALFLSYGKDNEHSRAHRRYYLYEREDLRYDDFSPELTQRLRAENLFLSLENSDAAELSRATGR